MTRVNLLPWREARRAAQQRQFYWTMGVGALLAVAGVIGVYLYIQNLIDNQEARNNYLRAEIEELKRAEEEIKRLDATKASLLARLEIIQNLQQSRPGMVKVYDTLVRRLPEDVFLTKFQVTGKDITLNGIASTNNVIAGFMRSLASSSDLFNEPVLTVVENQELNERVAASVFELKVAWKQAGSEPEGEKGTGGGAQ